MVGWPIGAAPQEVGEGKECVMEHQEARHDLQAWALVVGLLHFLERESWLCSGNW